MDKHDPNPASAKEQAEGSRENVNAGTNDAQRRAGTSNRKTEPDGKNDSGPEPEVAGQEIPPQD